MVLGVIVAYNCLKELFTVKAGSMADEDPEWSELGRKNVEATEAEAAASDAKVAQAQA